MRISLLLLAPLLLAAAPATQPTTQVVHDRDPWIFRCVLDGNARMVVVSLGNHYWAAYDAAHCALSKVWEGDVELTGAVYDMRHGPQPKAKGKVLLDRPAAVTMPYQVMTGLSTNLGQVGGTSAPTSATTPPLDTHFGDFAYRGYSLKDGLATFHFTHGADPTRDYVDETPSADVSASGAAVLRRHFVGMVGPIRSTLVARGSQVSLPTSSSVAKISLASGQVYVGGGMNGKLVKAPAEIEFDPAKNIDISLDSSEVVIDTEFKPSDQQPTSTAK